MKYVQWGQASVDLMGSSPEISGDDFEIKIHLPEISGTIFVFIPIFIN